MARVVRSAPKRWEGEQVTVFHHIDNSGVLSVGTTRGELELVSEDGLVLRASGGHGGEETHHFPVTSVTKIVLTDGQ